MPPTITTPQPSATGAHTRLRLKRLTFAIEIHATLETFDRNTGSFTAFLDTDPAGTPAETFTLAAGSGPGAAPVHYTDAKGFVWQVL